MPFFSGLFSKFTLLFFLLALFGCSSFREGFQKSEQSSLETLRGQFPGPEQFVRDNSFFRTAVGAPRSFLSYFHLFLGQWQLGNARREGVLEKSASLNTYQKACVHYLEAYYRDSVSFNLDKIGLAIEACDHAQDFKTAEYFKRFKEDYILLHYDESRRAPKWLKEQTRKIHQLEGSPYARNTMPSPTSAGNFPPNVIIKK